MKSENYRLEDIEKTWIEVSNARNSLDSSTLKEHLLLISRMLVWDDQHQCDLFDFACEVKMFEAITDIFAKGRDKQIINCILAFFTMLLSNLTHQPSLNYLLSHPSLSSIQLTKFGNMGNQVADYYINFLKVLSRKITKTNVQLFFNQRCAIFPLLTQAARFFNHPESLVRTTSRNILLTIAKLRDPRVDMFMAGFPFSSYYIHECNFLKEYWSIFEAVLRSEDDNRYELDQLQSLLQDHEQILIFLDDLLGLGQQGVALRFVDALINECLSPLAVAIDSEQAEGFSIKIALFFLGTLLRSFGNEFVVNALALIIFGKYYSENLMESLFEPIERLLSYDKKWKFKGFWDSHEDRILLYCKQKYHLIGTKKQQQSVIDSLSRRIDTFSVFGVTNNFYEREIQKIQKIFGIPILSDPHSIERKSGSFIINELIDKIVTRQVDITNFSVNPLAETTQSYLTSKDDSLVMLTLNLFSALLANRAVSPAILDFCKLSVKPQAQDFESLIRIEKTVISCLRLFQVDPPCYRLCTYSEAIDLIRKLIVLYSPIGPQLSIDIIHALRAALKTSIHRITPYLYGGKDFQRPLQIYQELVKGCTKKRSKSLKTFGLLPQDQGQQPQNLLAAVFDYFPRQFDQQIARDFWIYNLIQNLFLQCEKIHHFAKLPVIEPEKQKNNRFQEGKVILDLTEQTLKADYKTSSMDNYSSCEIVLLAGYFALLCNSRVQLKVNYQQLSVLIDKSDPRKILLQHEGGLTWIGLGDGKTALDLKRHFEQSRSIMLRYRLAQMVKQVELFLTVC